MHFASAGAASADLTLRRGLASTGTSQAAREPYSKLFSVETASISGSNLVLRLHPVQNRPGIFWQMLNTQDLSFAMCP
jgi:hypothetical protein